MKTKLLKKVRKEFKIEYYPNGDKAFPIAFVNIKWNFGSDRVYVSSVRFKTIKTEPTKQQAIERSKRIIILKLRTWYPKLGSYQNKFDKQRLWP